MPEQYNITIAMQCSVVEMHHLIKKYGLSMYFSISQKNPFIFYLPPDCLLT